MINVLRYKRVLYCGPLLGVVGDEDEFIKYKKARGLYIEDPWERVKTIFSKDDHGDPHPEITHAMDLFMLGAVTGICYGGLITAAKKSQDYKRSNDLNIYANKKEAMKAFVNHNTFVFLNGGLRKALPIGLFTFSFSVISSCCEAYYNRPRIINSSIAGIVVGSFSRFFFGIKGMISGGVVGGALGTLYGALIWATCKATRTDQIQLKYSQFALMHYRKERFDRVEKTSSSEDKDLHADKGPKH